MTTRWLTPKHYLEALGTFDTDPCAAPGHQTAHTMYMPENNMDGTKEPWHGRVWLNPPYGPESYDFIRRMAFHNNGTALLFARTDTAIWHEWVFPYASALLFMQGRIRFIDEHGTLGQAATAPSVFIAYGEHDAEALEASGIPGKFIRL